MSYMDQMKPSDVKDAKTFCRYCQQELGMPMPLKVYEITNINKDVKEFFKENPGANWETLCKVVQWAKGQKFRYATPYTLLNKGIPAAYQHKWLPELEPGNRPEDLDIENRIYAALRVETDEAFREPLILAAGPVRHLALQNWIGARPDLQDAFTKELENE